MKLTRYFSLLLIFLSACEPHPPIAVKNNIVGLQGKELKPGISNLETREFAVRLDFSSGDLSQISKEVQEELLYKADSFFYISAASRRIYPRLVQAIPNGRKDCFEYLVSFDKRVLDAQASWVLNYHDTFFDKKNHTYHLKN